MNFVELKSEGEFETFLNGGNVLVLNFFAAWAEPCKDMNQVFLELSKQYREMKFIQIEAEEFPEISEAFEVSSVPTFIVVRNKMKSAVVEGANAPLLSSTLEKQSKVINLTPLPVETEQNNSPPVTDEYLKSLITSHPIMLFMKGTPYSPKCKYSKATIELLNSLNISYGSYNILSNAQVREKLKVFSDWPTYPQIYVNGELIGGLDILKEMIESGEFQEIIPKEEDIETRIQKIINKAPVMLFMKGSADSPKCGFSNKIVGLLKDQGIQFETFDILTDEEVRQELKKISNWPTYPQLYIKGELVGGLDIVKEMIDEGSFKSLFD